MPSPERKQIQSSEVFAPGDKLGGDTSSLLDPDDASKNLSTDANLEANPAQFAEFLEQEFSYPAVDVYIETKLRRTGWLPVLEQAGVIPGGADPNPFDAEQEQDQYEQWWREHPAELEMFSQNFEQRIRALKYLHIGAIIGRIAGRRLYPGRVFPGTQAPSAEEPKV
jgi:hypothetical protein